MSRLLSTAWARRLGRAGAGKVLVEWLQPSAYQWCAVLLMEAVLFIYLFIYFVSVIHASNRTLLSSTSKILSSKAREKKARSPTTSCSRAVTGITSSEDAGIELRLERLSQRSKVVP
jgi:hypothetical protein